jgi:hypothetical protein
MVGRCHFVSESSTALGHETHNTVVPSTIESVFPLSSYSTLPPKKKQRQHSTSGPLAKPKRSSAAQVHGDALGKYVDDMARKFQQSGWHGVLRKTSNRGDLRPNIDDFRHLAIRLLKHLGKHGTPVRMHMLPWSSELRQERLDRGSHKSCDEHLGFLREEMMEFASSGFWTLLPFRLVKDMLNLHISPLGIIPQRDRWPRLIVDYSFWGINDDMVKLSPAGAM